MQLAGQGATTERDPTVPDDFKSGDEVFSIDPAIIVAIDYQSPTQRITVERSKGGPCHFQVITEELNTGRRRSCDATAELYAAVIGLTSFVRSVC